MRRAAGVGDGVGVAGERSAAVTVMLMVMSATEIVRFIE